MKIQRVSCLLLAGLILAATGCVSQNERDRLQTLNRKCEEQVIELKAQLEEARARMAALQNMAPQQDPNLLAELNSLRSERDQLNNKLASLEERIRQLALTETPLPAELSDALAQLAQQYSDVMEYDPARGMLKFKSDLTFALGSADVNPKARESLVQLANILKTVTASGYDARIVGHTDNVRIARADTRAAHPTNWHLSVHRAIAVKDVLEQSGIPSTRLGVAGYGEYRPIAANGPRGNEVNRRVEIYIVPSTYTPVSGSSAPAGESAPARVAPTPAPAEPEPFK